MVIPPNTDEGKRAWLRDGKELFFSAPPTTGEETAEQKAARTIRTAWLEDLTRHRSRAMTVPIRINNAVLEGSLNLKDTTFKYEVSIMNSEFTGPANFSFCTFERNLVLPGCRFRESINCASAVARYWVVLDDSDFRGSGVNFDDARVSGGSIC
jgi:hypothetical protein